MERRLLILGMVMLCASGARAELLWNANLDLALIDTGPAPSFADHSQGKLMFGRDDSALQLLGGYVQVQAEHNAVWNTKVAVNLNTQTDRSIGIVDAFAQYRPLPTHGIRWRAKLGAFRPPISFEHGADAWSSLYTTNASAINSWVGEEIGHLGVELTAKRDLASNPGDWYWALSGAGFYGNDVAGTLLSWRGWSLNNWQTPWGGTVPLYNSQTIQFVSHQVPASEPFLELDDRPGYYYWLEAGVSHRVRLRAMHWNNRARTDVTGHGQSGWRTLFDSLGIQANLPWNIGLIAQAMRGVTYAGPVLWGGRHAVDNAYDAQFLLLTRTFGPHRLTLRRDWFEVDDRDFNPIDPNDESGKGWTAAYRYRLNEAWTLGLEYLSIDSSRPARLMEGLPVSLSEDTWMATLRWRH